MFTQALINIMYFVCIWSQGDCLFFYCVGEMICIPFFLLSLRPLFVPLVFFCGVSARPGFFRANNKTFRFNLLFVCFFFVCAYMSCVDSARCGLLCVLARGVVFPGCRGSIACLYLPLQDNTHHGLCSSLGCRCCSRRQSLCVAVPCPQFGEICSLKIKTGRKKSNYKMANS